MKFSLRAASDERPEFRDERLSYDDGRHTCEHTRALGTRAHPTRAGKTRQRPIPLRGKKNATERTTPITRNISSRTMYQMTTKTTIAARNPASVGNGMT